jgi:hypothetical protein
MWVCGELDERVRRGTEQDIVQVFLVSTYKVPQLLGQGQDDMKVGDRQEFLPSLFHPRLGVLVVAFRATAVPAGVIDVVLLTAMVTLQQLPAQGFGPAVNNIVHGPPVTGQQVLPNPVEVLSSIAPQDIRHLWHGRAPGCLEVGHEGIDGGVHDIQDRRR